MKKGQKRNGNTKDDETEEDGTKGKEQRKK